MGVGDWIKDKVTPQFVKDVNTALTPPAAPATPPATPPAPAEATTPQQKAYEAKEAYMNRNNPSYVPRAKGGPVKKGGALWNGQPVKKC
jgi:hypothetical protein